MKENKIPEDFLKGIMSSVDEAACEWLEKCSNKFTDGETEEENVISLREFIKAYQELNLNFLKEYAELDKIDIGKVDFESYFSTNVYGNTNYDCLTLGIKDKTIDIPVPFGSICNININKTGDYIDKARFFSVTYDDIGRPEEHTEYKDYDKDKMLGYLNLFDKYAGMLTASNVMSRKPQICNKNFYSLQVYPNLKDGNIINGINGFEFSITCLHLLRSQGIEDLHIYVDLRDGMKVDYTKSRLVINGTRELIINDEIFEKALDIIKFNRSYLEDYYLDYNMSSSEKGKRR